METEHGEGRLQTLEGCAYSMEQPYAARCMESLHLAARVKQVGVLGARVS